VRAGCGHSARLLTGRGGILAGAVEFNFANGAVHTARITYDGTVLSVDLENADILSWTWN